MAVFRGENESIYLSSGTWQLLVDLIFDKCEDLVKREERERWYGNYGEVVRSKMAIDIADQLEQLIKEGVVKRYETGFKTTNPKKYFTEDDVKSFITFCRHSGGFHIWGRCPMSIPA